MTFLKTKTCLVPCAMKLKHLTEKDTTMAKSIVHRATSTLQIGEKVWTIMYFSIKLQLLNGYLEKIRFKCSENHF